MNDLEFRRRWAQAMIRATYVALGLCGLVAVFAAVAR